jgi:hypothetical protein
VVDDGDVELGPWSRAGGSIGSACLYAVGEKG